MSLELSASPEELRNSFSQLQDRRDIGKLLDIDLQILTYHLYRVPEADHYSTFEIPKNLGGTRVICAPVTTLKIIQRKLNQVLQSVYRPHKAAHSYIHKRNILTNAKEHSQSELIFNIDLKDFFPSINPGRVMGLFMHPPYNCKPVVASTLAKICCFNNALPQGAPSSPVISNMIAAKMDRQLSKLARKYDCSYTRYADDITFSTLDDSFPIEILKYDSKGKMEVGDELRNIIYGNGFYINPDKVRLRNKCERQIVTGLVTNVFPNVRREYVRKIRAMLHAWEKFGFAAAESEFRSRYDKKHRDSFRSTPSFKQVVKGKIDYLGMVRGKDNPIYLHFRHKLRGLSPELVNGQETPLEFLLRTSRTTTAKHIVRPLTKSMDDTTTVSHLLNSIDPSLEIKRTGAWQTYYSSSADRISQATHSMREVLSQLLDKLAPDDSVRGAPWYIEPSERPKVQRKMRIRYILSGSDSTVSKSTTEYIDAMAKMVEMTYAKLSNEAHKYGINLDSTVKTYLETCEIVIKSIILHRQV